MKLLQRAYQRGMHGAMFLLKWREPVIIPSLGGLWEKLCDEGIERPLIVTDAGVIRAGLLNMLIGALGDIPASVYDRTVANPTIRNAEEAADMYLRDECDCLIALGGGSPMDCAKAAGIRLARPTKPLWKLRGQLRVRKPLPMLIAIPTTAGTGSEATLAAVITDEETHQKASINDLHLIPDYAVLDAKLTASMPPAITAATGMDALTHAIEAYIGHSTTKQTRAASLEAIELIAKYLPVAYADGQNLKARKKMQRAAYLAGTAFTRSFVGYVHAIAHQLGALYGTPHGLANAIILPHVLAYYGASAEKKLVDVARAMGIETGATSMDTAKACIRAIQEMNAAMGIPTHVAGIRQEDIPRIVRGALKEANPLYPVPRILGRAQMEELVGWISARQ